LRTTDNEAILKRKCNISYMRNLPLKINYRTNWVDTLQHILYLKNLPLKIHRSTNWFDMEQRVWTLHRTRCELNQLIRYLC